MTEPDDPAIAGAEKLREVLGLPPPGDLTAQELDCIWLYATTIDTYTAHRMVAEIRRSRLLRNTIHARLIEHKVGTKDAQTAVNEIIQLLQDDTDERLNLKKEKP